MGDLDRALSQSRKIEPPPGFEASVMLAVRRAAEAPPPLPFPWKQTIIGLSICVTLTIVAATIVMTSGPLPPIPPEWIDRTLAVASSTPLQWTIASLLVSLVSFRFAMRLAGHRP